MVVLQSGKNGYFCFSGLRYFFHSQCPFAWSNLISLLLRYLIILEARMFHVDSYNVVQFTNSSKITDSDKYAEYQEAIFQGAFYQLAPATITLAIIVLVQNVVIFADYFKDRNKFVPSLFMGIALSDILKAQGELILAVISILVFAGHLDIMILYNCIFYYMITALPGINCSKLFNVILSIAFTLQVVDPFRRINTDRWRKILLVLCLVVSLLHLSDTLAAILFHCTYLNDSSSTQYKELYLCVVVLFDIPGVVTLGALVCTFQNVYLKPDSDGDHFSVCSTEKRDKTFLRNGAVNAIFFPVLALYYLVPVCVVLTCMVRQIKHLRRFFDENNSESSALLPNPTRHVSITVFLISILFFFCHTIFFALLSFLCFLNPKIKDIKQDYVNIGVLFGLAQFSLPLIYAAVYPIIIISRKQELRQRYMGYMRRAISCFQPNENVTHPNF